MLVSREISKKMFVFEQLVVTGQGLAGHFSETLFVDIVNYVLVGQQSLSKTTHLFFIIMACMLGLKMYLLL